MAKRKRTKKVVKKGKTPANYIDEAKVKPVLIVSLENGSTVAATCVGAGISRDTFYRWCKEDPKFGEKVEAAQESRVQHVEDALYKNAINGVLTAQIFFLCNRAPDKWKNVQKVEASFNGPVPINFVPYDPAKHAQPGNKP